MTDYTYSTRHDPTLFAEDPTKVTPSTGTTIAPPRVTGATVTAYQQGTTTQLGTLTTQASGWFNGTLTAPVADLETSTGRVTVFSKEWIHVRGRSFRPVVHADTNTDPALVCRGDESVLNGQHVHWTGTKWENL